MLRAATPSGMAREARAERACRGPENVEFAPRNLDTVRTILDDSIERY